MVGDRKSGILWLQLISAGALGQETQATCVFPSPIKGSRNTVPNKTLQKKGDLGEGLSSLLPDIRVLFDEEMHRAVYIPVHMHVYVWHGDRGSREPTEHSEASGHHQPQFSRPCL